MSHTFCCNRSNKGWMCCINRHKETIKQLRWVNDGQKWNLYFLKCTMTQSQRRESVQGFNLAQKWRKSTCCKLFLCLIMLLYRKVCYTVCFILKWNWDTFVRKMSYYPVHQTATNECQLQNELFGFWRCLNFLIRTTLILKHPAYPTNSCFSQMCHHLKGK